MKTMLVTGASSGIGWQLAIRAARAGYAVYAVGRDAAALEALRAKIEHAGGSVAVDAIDIAAPAAARPLIARVVARFASLDVVVNNAGFASIGRLSDQTDEALQRQFGTHVIGPLAIAREALAALRTARGHVFMVGSGVARVPLGGFGAYPPAKAALRSATAILRRELRPLGVAVTYVDPGAVATPFMQRAGMQPAPAAFLTSPQSVARKILIAAGRRPAELNAVPWQTAGVALAERFPRLTEMLLARVPTLVGGTATAEGGSSAAAAHVAPATIPIVEVPSNAVSEMPFGAALEPLRRRMQKLNLRDSFVQELLVPHAQLELGDVAMRWAGMPNKNERAITLEVLEALADAGFLERLADQRYIVVRSA